MRANDGNPCRHITHTLYKNLNRVFQLGLLLFLLSAPAMHAQQAADLSSPRATFRSYLVSMVIYGSDTTGAVKEAALKKAMSCIDLDGLPAALRAEQGVKVARELKLFLDRYEFVVIDDIPDKFDGPVYVWRKPIAKAEVSIGLSEDSSWLFTRKTVASLPTLLELVADKEVVEGVETMVPPDTFADWMRSRMPESLLNKAVYFENWQWIAILVVVILGILVEQLVIRLLSKWIVRFIRSSKATTEFKLDTQLIKPLGILAMALLWSALLSPLDLTLQAETILFFATQFVIAVSGVWAAYRLVDLVAGYFAVLASRTESKFDDMLVPMIRRALKIIVIAFGLLFIADNLNIDITSLLAGLGIGGVAVALAAKDTVENLFGSLTVMFDKPFDIGDWIKIGDLEGNVEEVGFRSTRIRTFYNSQITMPNSRLVSAAVDNMGRRRYRRISVKLGVQYDTTPEKMDAFCEGIREIVRRHPYTRKDFYMVYVNEFADFSINILLYVFHETPDWPTELRERHRLFVDIVRLAKRLGVNFAFPTQTLHVGSMPQPMHVSSQPVTPVAPQQTGSMEDPIIIGRNEADALLSEHWDGSIQPPVQFSDPLSMKPGNAPDSHTD
ncbi:MAG: mechanosensitive ion channel family protein [Ignavibacteria bacterium]|nr:MAG: mechanosensitive ion channel family protein [Ignavibacteria bacterium]